jgi:hypothetical protein
LFLFLLHVDEFQQVCIESWCFFPRVAVELFPCLTNLLAHIGFVCRLLKNFNRKPGRHGTDEIDCSLHSIWHSQCMGILYNWNPTLPFNRSTDGSLKKISASSHILFDFQNMLMAGGEPNVLTEPDQFTKKNLHTSCCANRFKDHLKLLIVSFLLSKCRPRCFGSAEGG